MVGIIGFYSIKMGGFEFGVYFKEYYLWILVVVYV